MKKTFLLLAAFLITFCTLAQNTPEVTKGNGNLTKESRNVGAFTKLRANGPFHIRLVSGTDDKISVEADNNIIGLIVTEVKDGELIIGPKEGKLFRSGGGNKMIIKVPADKLTSIMLKGSGSIISRKALDEDLTISLEGSGNIDLNLNSANAEAKLLGSGNIKLAGASKLFVCKVIGSGNITANELDAATVEATVSGSGNAKVNSSKIIRGRITGSGNIAFSGNPETKDLQKDGSGEFRTL